MTLTFRPFERRDWPQVWAILEPVFRAGESYPCPTEISERDAQRYWIETPQFTFVALDTGNSIAGTYYLRPDQMGLGAHICNCGYAVAARARGRGYAVVMCRHSQVEARRYGFLGMKFNLVVATNEAAIRAWKKSGMKIIGTTPKAFRHTRFGLVDAHIMYKDLTTP